MPISVKTMRDTWDEEKEEKQKKEKEVKKHKIFPPEIEKYHLEYLARRKAFLERKEEIAKIFADYESRLGDGGFSRL